MSVPNGLSAESLRELYKIESGLILGLDIGIASCGWALIDTKAQTILNAGTWAFEPPEVPKTRESKAKARRIFRGQRRRLRRRRQRMRNIRQLLHDAGLLPSALPPRDEKGVRKPVYDPWALRAQALDQLLSGENFAACLLHIAKHRGYRSNSKSEKAQNAPAENKKVLSGIAAVVERSARWRTVGEMFACDERFAEKKRNRDGDYTHTIKRSLHEAEVRKLFEAQAGFGASFATPELEERYGQIAFHQRPLQDSETLLGDCPFEPGEKRASAVAYSFERFRFLSKLVHSRVDDGSTAGRTLTAEELTAAVQGFGATSKTISWKKLKTLIGLPRNARFVGVADDMEGRDAARASKGAAYGSNTLYRALGEAAWQSLIKTPETLDAIAHVLTFREDVDRIRTGLEDLDLDPLIHDALMQAVEEGAFASFSKVGHISTAAARNILPHLNAGFVYSEACAAAGYDHSVQIQEDLEALNNPVAKRAILQTLKQVNALVRTHGARPQRIHVELGREVGKGPEERGRIKKGIDDRTAAREKAKQDFCNLVDRLDCSPSELQHYELWQEQEHFCMFCDPKNDNGAERYIEPHDLLDDRNRVEIEHILPLSQSHDNSWNNKALACIKCNREKTNQTPWKWFGERDEERWQRFETYVHSLKRDGRIKGLKVRNLLMKTFEDRQQEFLKRNLNDTRYTARVVQAELKGLYSEAEQDGVRRIFARPGQITATLRRFWGLDPFKYLPDEKTAKERIEDERHHAVDAIVVAACSEHMLQNLTKAIQKEEEQGLPIRGKGFEPPWDGFRDDVAAARDRARVARSENRRARGAGHAATIRKLRQEDARRIAYERTAIDKLTPAALDRIKDPERNRDVVDAVSAWLDAGKPKDAPPRRNNGYPINKVTLRSESNPRTERAGFEVHKGLVDNADMVRLDVFEKEGKTYLVPVYAHQIANRAGWPRPPNLAIKPNAPESEWLQIDNSYTFRFSLFPFSWIEAVDRKGVIYEGYYRGADRSNGRITYSHELSRSKTERFGTRLLASFKKFHVDRLGQRHEVRGEPRQWHGADST